MMQQFTVSVETLFNGEDLLQQQSVTISNGRIVSIDKCSATKSDILSGTLVPGFIDVQVNGGGGYLFNQSPTIDCLRHIGRAHQQFGTSGWLPTLVSDSLSQMQYAANAVAQAIKSNEAGILGIHFEGPHLSVAKKGVHNKKYIRELSKAERELFIRSDLGKVVVTLAPENVAPDVIAELVAEGDIVCLGHSNATFEQAQQALNAGATGFTHLFNAMSPLTSREPGMVGAALLAENCYAGLILDGIHVHPHTAKVAIHCLSTIMLVTDAMPPVGTLKNSFELYGQSISRDGDTLRDNHGRLAGSVIDMASAVKNCTDLLGLSIEKAVNLASLNPARFLGLDDEYGSLSVGKKASMVLLDNKCKVVANWIDGVQVFS